jgi:hypothetical protein
MFIFHIPRIQGMPNETLKRQIELCDSNKNTENFASSIEALFSMLPANIRSEILKKDGIYKETPSYVTRFINNVPISIEIVTDKTLDHYTLYLEILDKVEKL